MTIRWDPPRLCVSNDGAADTTGVEGTGLRGLRERLASLGEALAHRVESGTFHLVALLPTEAPGTDLAETR